MSTTGTVSTSISAGPITATGLGSPVSGQQITMGYRLFIYLQPEIARQWIGVLETIAPKDK